MSSLIEFTFDPMDEGVSRDEWAKFTAEHALVLQPGNGMFYQGGVEAEYTSKWRISFSANGDQSTRDNQILLALIFWKQFGGSMYASPEVRETLTESFTSLIS